MQALVRGLIVLLAFVVAGTAARSEIKERYGFKQARIVVEKKTKNASVELTAIDTVYIDDWGWVEVRYSHVVQDVRMIKQKTESWTVSIMEREWLTTYDPVKKKGNKMKNPFYATIGNLSGEQQKGMAEGMAKAFEAKATAKGTEEIAGKMCDVTETRVALQGMETVTTTWMWKGLVVKLVSNGMGTEITELVTSINEGVGVRSDLKKIPDDVEIIGPAK